MFYISGHSKTLLDSITPILNCKICNQYGFQNKEAWKAHHVTYHKTDDVALCEACCKTFKTTNGFQYHNLIYHTSEENKYLCKVCNKSFISEYKLKIHQTVHSSAKRFKCIKCENSYKYIQDLRKHLQTKHWSDRLYAYLFSLD